MENRVQFSALIKEYLNKDYRLLFRNTVRQGNELIQLGLFSLFFSILAMRN